MESLQKVFEEVLQEKIKSGELVKKAEAYIDKMIEDVLQDQTRKYSDFGKVIEQKLKEALGYAVSEFSFQDYSLLLANNIKTSLNKYYSEEALKLMESRVDELLRPANLEEKTIAGILKAYVYSCRYNEEPIHYYIEDERSSFVMLYLGEKSISCHNKYQTATHWIGFYRKGKENTGEVYTIKANNRDIAKDRLLIGSDFEALLFKLLAGKEQISLDYSEDVLDEICQPEDEDDD